MVLKREVISTSSISGFPFAVESHRELIHIASNWSSSPLFATIVFSAIKPVRPLCTSNVFTMGHNCINCFRRFLLYSGILNFSFIRVSIRLVFSLYVYGTSITCPPYSAKSRTTFSRIAFIGPSTQLSP